MSATASPLDAIELRIVLGALHAACTEMGALLVRAAHSPNIKERHDASSALFDELVTATRALAATHALADNGPLAAGRAPAGNRPLAGDREAQPA